jgi:hypothetical protein
MIFVIPFLKLAEQKKYIKLHPEDKMLEFLRYSRGLLITITVASLIYGIFNIIANSAVLKVTISETEGWSSDDRKKSIRQSAKQLFISIAISVGLYITPSIFIINDLIQHNEKSLALLYKVSGIIGLAAVSVFLMIALYYINIAIKYLGEKICECADTLKHKAADNSDSPVKIIGYSLCVILLAIASLLVVALTIPLLLLQAVIKIVEVAIRVVIYPFQKLIECAIGTNKSTDKAEIKENLMETTKSIPNIN